MLEAEALPAGKVSHPTLKLLKYVGGDWRRRLSKPRRHTTLLTGAQCGGPFSRDREPAHALVPRLPSGQVQMKHTPTSSLVTSRQWTFPELLWSKKRTKAYHHQQNLPSHCPHALGH